MATLSRPQLVLDTLQHDGQDLTHTTLQVVKTDTMTYGTILKADFTEATATELAEGTWDAPYVVDDYRLLDTDVVTGDELTIRALSQPQFTVLRESQLKLGSTALDAGELALYKAGANPIDTQA